MFSKVVEMLVLPQDRGERDDRRFSAVWMDKSSAGVSSGAAKGHVDHPGARATTGEAGVVLANILTLEPASDDGAMPCATVFRPCGRPMPLRSIVLPGDLIQYCRLEPSMETPVRRVIFVLLVLTATAHAQGVIFTFDQWARLSSGLQEI